MTAWRSRRALLEEFARTYQQRPNETVTAAVARAARLVGVGERTGWRYLTDLRHQGALMALPSQIHAATRTSTPTPGSAEESRAQHVLYMPTGTPEDEVAERRAAAEKVTDWAAQQHPCELSVDVRVCRHPHHARDADEAVELLLALGLMEPSMSPESTATQPRKLDPGPGQPRVVGRCPVCRTRQKLRGDGTVGLHSADGWACDGYGEQPMTDGEEE